MGLGNGNTGDTGMWSAIGPEKWPAPPTVMSISLLSALESCPRQWALSRADYRKLWAGMGYPPRLQLYALSGSIVHKVLERVTDALIEAGCASVQDATATDVMRKLGGYSKVIQEVADEFMASARQNPRAQPLLESTSRVLRTKTAEFRGQVQGMLGSVRLPGGMRRSGQDKGVGARGPIVTGTVAEAGLQYEAISWKGTADVLAVSDKHCEIVDFKTGQPDPEHHFQLRVYALLWARDKVLNPSGRLADKLTLAYKSGYVSVQAPSNQELDTLEAELIARTDAAKSLAKASPPEARPSAGQCRYCAVRHLCTEYWRQETQVKLGNAPESPATSFGDIQVAVTGRHGALSWDGVSVISRKVGVGKNVVIRVSPGAREFRTGGAYRILDAHHDSGKERAEDPTVITLSASSEAFAL